jgi:DNA-binding NtrC family response regulator
MYTNKLLLNTNDLKPEIKTGATGTGKARLAERLHQLSGRDPLVAINCGALPRELVASELFGHVRGAFSGASAAHAGMFVKAHGGTLFLDEICELPSDVQPVLLRALDGHGIRPVGGNVEQAVDVRVIAASNADVPAAIANGTFRADLHARLTARVLSLPPLASVRERIVGLVGTLARETQAPTSWSADALEALLLWDWPYNIRQLRSLVEAHRGVVPSGELVSIAHLGQVRSEIAAHFAACRNGTKSPSPAAELGRAEVEQLLGRFGGNVSAVAKELGKSRTATYRLMQRVGVPLSEDE